MISISGIKHQKELEDLPVFNKQQASILIGKTGRNLDKKIEQLTRIKYLLPIKKGLYTTAGFYDACDKNKFQEYAANMIRQPSYISLEYALFIYGLIPEGVFAVTCITTKSSRVYSTFLGNYIYQNLNKKLFLGYQEIAWGEKQILFATKAKALFDFIYLKKMNSLKTQLTSDLRINWHEFCREDCQEFNKYVHLSKSSKMKKAYNIINKLYDY